MKYSLRSLMIVVTLICVVLGGVAVRIEYLRRWAAYHEREARRFDLKMIRRLEIEVENSGSRNSRVSTFSFSNGGEDARASDYHEEMARLFRQAAYRPWRLVSVPEGVEPL